MIVYNNLLYAAFNIARYSNELLIAMLLYYVKLLLP